MPKTIDIEGALRRQGAQVTVTVEESIRRIRLEDPELFQWCMENGFIARADQAASANQ